MGKNYIGKTILKQLIGGGDTKEFSAKLHILFKSNNR